MENMFSPSYPNIESNIREWLKFYDSIPAYYEIHHLPEKDFYMTLRSLRETCCELREKSKSVASINDEICLTCYEKNKEKNKEILMDSVKTTGRKSTRSKSVNSLVGTKTKSRAKRTQKKKDDTDYSLELDKITQNGKDSSMEKDKAKDSTINTDFNEIKINIQKESKDNDVQLENPISARKIRNTSSCSSGSKSKTKQKNHFAFLGFPTNNTKNKTSSSISASPVYPAARSNLAATLRAEVSRKKRCRLSECSIKGEHPHVDWEVRKSAAWKTLQTGESNKDDISFRVATRKAEHKLQQREYKINMELMRQRVKAAPLLMEGPTYWNSKCKHSCCNEYMRSSIERPPSKYKFLNETRKSKAKHANQSGESDDLDSEDRAYL